MELDPRYLIAQATQFVDHDVSAGWHAVNLDLGPGAAPDSRLRALQAILKDDGRIDAAHFSAPAEFSVATATVTSAGLQVLEKLADARSSPIQRFEYAQPLKLPRIRPVPALTLPSGLLSGSEPHSAQRAVSKDVFAVIDYGCPFMHPLLCTATASGGATRVRALWDQQPSAGNGTPTAAPNGFSYGSELSRGQLDAVIQLAGGDERAAYASLGYEAMHGRASHGAHTLGMLLDDDLRPRACKREQPRPDVLFVQLPQSLLSAPNRGTLSRHVIDALVWIEAHRKSDERVILALGQGSSQGPHDGSSIVEQALRAFTTLGPPRAKNRVFIAAGNGFEEGLHAQTSLEPSVTKSVAWRVPPDSELPATVEIWVPRQPDGGMAQVNVELLAPGGRGAIEAGPQMVAHFPDARAAAASIASTAWQGVDCTLTLIRLAPTQAPPGRARAPSGDWIIRLTAQTAVATEVHLYIGRIKRALGFPLRTAQSIFVPRHQPGFVGPSGRGTLQGLATAAGVSCVGGVVGGGDEPPPARYSSRGPSRHGKVIGPEFSVRSDDGSVLQGRRSIGNLSGVTFRMDGTSVAAPLAARLYLTRVTGKLPRGKQDPEARGGLLLEPRKLLDDEAP